MLLRPDTPDGQVADLKITHKVVPAGKPHEVVSIRNALMMGQQRTNITFDEPLKIRNLSYKGGVWMTDSAQEVWQMRDALEQIKTISDLDISRFCNVLVGGLGLGLFSRLAEKWADARVTTIEKDRRVIDLIQFHGDVVHADIYDFCRDLPESYGSRKQPHIAFLDTWQSTGEWCWNHEVVPLRRLIGDKIPKVICWNEEEMIGQIAGPFGSGYRRMLISLDVTSKGDIASSILRHLALERGITDITYDGDEWRTMKLIEDGEKLKTNPDAQDLVRRLTTDAGSPTWEAEFGELWDRYQNAYDDWKLNREVTA